MIRCTTTFLAGAFLAADPAVAGEPPSFPIWPADQRAGYAAYEAALNAIPSRESLLDSHQILASEPHIAGTPGDARVIEAIAATFADLGLEVQRHEFNALLARPVAASLRIVSPEPLELPIAEAPLPEDRFSQHPERTYGWNAYSGSGDVTSTVVYANYGTKADFARLAELGVDCRGKIVLARYGGNYRGFKVKFAEAAGAAGVIIYVDPADSGFVKGPTYPEGGYANPTCIERGSINTLPYPGDPLTPGVEATRDAQRLDPATVDLPRIPVQPIGYAAAAQILERMTGPEAPEAWKGGLPCTYRLTGGDDLRVHLKVEQSRAIIPTSNVIGILRGATEPETRIIIGCHHDAWVCGAADPTCGTITLMEAAKSFATLARRGQRPARTIVFAAWGAEEFGIVGSTEWVEGNRADLLKNAAMYINLDMASMGINFSASTTPSLRPLIAAAAGSVPQPRDEAGRTVFEAWLSRGEDPVFPGFPRFGDLGGGSDHIGFVCHAAIASTTLGGGGSRGTAYHSVYDTLPWYWKVVGADYASSQMVTRMVNAVAGRMACAPVLPLDPSRYGPETKRALDGLTDLAERAGLVADATDKSSSPFAALYAAVERFTTRAGAARTALADAVASGRLSAEQRSRLNAILIACDRAWLSEEGLPGRPWFRNLYAASDEDSGYAAWVLPGVRRAIERRDRGVLEHETRRIEQVFERLTELTGAMEAVLAEPGTAGN